MKLHSDGIPSTVARPKSSFSNMHTPLFFLRPLRAALALTLATVAGFAQSIAGKWEINAGGNKGVLIIEQDGSSLTGYYRMLSPNDGECALRGTIQNGEVQFTRVGDQRRGEQHYRGFLFARDASTMAGTYSGRGERDSGWYAHQTEARPYEQKRSYPEREHARPNRQSRRTIVGSWDWAAGQTIKAREDGTLIVYEGNRQINSGKWEKQSDGSFRFTYQSGGFIDTVRLSDDGESIFGKNNRGKDLRGTRTERFSASIVGTWSWSAGQSLVVYPNGKLSVYEGDRQINSGQWERLPDDSIRFTHAMGGFVDTVKLSPDGQRIEGRNKNGKRVEGTRLD
jgi:hypothetical protein